MLILFILFLGFGIFPRIGKADGTIDEIGVQNVKNAIGNLMILTVNGKILNYKTRKIVLCTVYLCAGCVKLNDDFLFLKHF